MTEEKKPKEIEKIKTIQEGIFRCERELMDVNDSSDYVVSLADQIRRELSTLEDGHAKEFDEELEEIMADEDNQELWLDTYNTLMGAGLTGGYPLDQIEKVVERRTQQRKAGRLMTLEAKISRTKEMRVVKPVMRTRGKQMFDKAHPELKDG